MNVLVSVIMAAYNSEKYIAKAIESILSQTYKYFELIIVDDGSTDNTFKEASRFCDGRIWILRNEKNSGTLYSMRRAVEAAKGEYIAILDSDDISAPERLERQVALLNRKPEVLLCATKAKNLNRSRIESRVGAPVRNARQLKFSLLFANDVISHSTVMFRKNALEERGIQYERFGYCHDFYLILCVSLISPIYVINEELGIYRIHSGQKTNTLKKEKIYSETAQALQLYIKKLDGLEEGERQILYKAVTGGLQTFQEFVSLKKALFKYAALCGLSWKRDREIIKFEFQRIYAQQKKSCQWHLFCFLNKYLVGSGKMVVSGKCEGK